MSRFYPFWLLVSLGVAAVVPLLVLHSVDRPDRRSWRAAYAVIASLMMFAGGLGLLLGLVAKSVSAPTLMVIHQAAPLAFLPLVARGLVDAVVARRPWLFVLIAAPVAWSLHQTWGFLVGATELRRWLQPAHRFVVLGMSLVAEVFCVLSIAAARPEKRGIDVAGWGIQLVAACLIATVGYTVSLLAYLAPAFFLSLATRGMQRAGSLGAACQRGIVAVGVGWLVGALGLFMAIPTGARPIERYPEDPPVPPGEWVTTVWVGLPFPFVGGQLRADAGEYLPWHKGLGWLVLNFALPGLLVYLMMCRKKITPSPRAVVGWGLAAFAAAWLATLRLGQLLD